jgi:Na+-driven multidrug efflux pump
MPALSSAVMITFVNPFGMTALAGYGVVRNLELIMFMPTNAMSMAVTSIIGQCKGAERMDRGRQYLKESMVIGGAFIGALSGLVIGSCTILSGWFGQGAEVSAIVASFFHIVSIGYVLYMLTSCVQGYITGAGRPEMAMMLLIAYYIVFRIPAAILLKTSIGLSGIWFAFLVSHVLACVLAFAIMCFIRDRQQVPQSLCFRV